MSVQAPSPSQIAPASPLFLREDEIRRGIEMLYFGYSALTRSIDEGLAAQGLGRAHHRALYFISRQPDLTVWFDVPPAVAAQRLASARVPDRFESQSQAFFERVAGGYAQRMNAHPARFARIDSDQSRDAVWHQVRLAFEQRGWLHANGVHS